MRIALAPPSGRGARVTSPPRLRSECRAIVRPIPTPTVRLELTKGSNIRSRISSAIPEPLSSTRISTTFSPRGLSTRPLHDERLKQDGPRVGERIAPVRLPGVPEHLGEHLLERLDVGVDLEVAHGVVRSEERRVGK